MTTLDLQLDISQIAKTLKSMSIRYQSHTFVPDQYLININPRVLAIRDVLIKDFQFNHIPVVHLDVL